MKQLSNLGVLITRPRLQAQQLEQDIISAGGCPFLLPVLEIESIPVQIKPPDPVQLAIFISPNAVRFGLPWLKTAYAQLPQLAAVGEGTAKALREQDCPPQLVPTTSYDSEALLALPEIQMIKGWQIVIIRGEGGRPLLGDVLRQRGATLDYLEVYRRICPQTDIKPLLAHWAKVHLVIATSNTIIENLVQIFGSEKQKLLAMPLLVISPRMSEYAKKAGFQRILLAERASNAAILDALFKAKETLGDLPKQRYRTNHVP